MRRGRDATMKTRGDGWRRAHLIPAVEYLQAQRVRGQIQRQLAGATGRFDVYVAPYLDLRAMRPQAPPPTGPIMAHFTAANLCGYPCISVPNGFTSTGVPTSITFLGRPYGEAAMLAVAKAYQDSTAWGARH